MAATCPVAAGAAARTPAVIPPAAPSTTAASSCWTLMPHPPRRRWPPPPGGRPGRRSCSSSRASSSKASISSTFSSSAATARTAAWFPAWWVRNSSVVTLTNSGSGVMPVSASSSSWPSRCFGAGSCRGRALLWWSPAAPSVARRAYRLPLADHVRLVGADVVAGPGDDAAQQVDVGVERAGAPSRNAIFDSSFFAAFVSVVSVAFHSLA